MIDFLADHAMTAYLLGVGIGSLVAAVWRNVA